MSDPARTPMLLNCTRCGAEATMSIRIRAQMRRTGKYRDVHNLALPSGWTAIAINGRAAILCPTCSDIVAGTLFLKMIGF